MPDPSVLPPLVGMRRQIKGVQTRSGWIPFEVGVADKLGFDGLVLVEQDGSGRGFGIFNADPLPSVKEIA